MLRQPQVSTLRSKAESYRRSIFIVFALSTILISCGHTQTAAADTCTTGLLPPGNGGDLTVTTGTCMVGTGTYKYRNVNIYGGGTLLFEDQPASTTL